MTLVEKYNLVDKSVFPKGPWSTEPDRIIYITPCGLLGLIERNDLGNLCGYVGIADGHPAFGLGYNKLDVSCHCGLTYGNFSWIEGLNCPVMMFYGFDCAHLSTDIVPAWVSDPMFSSMFGNSTYKDVTFVRNEINQLAQQFYESQYPISEQVHPGNG